MDGGAWWATVHGVAKESDTTERLHFHFVHLGFPGGSERKESAYNADSIPVLGRSPGGGHSNPLQCSCLKNPHGQRSLVGYSPWGHKESNTTEQLSTIIHLL